MIDRVEEVLRAMESGAEENRLLDLLSRRGTALLSRTAAAGETEGIAPVAEQVWQGTDRPLPPVRGVQQEAAPLMAGTGQDSGGSVLQSLYRRTVEAVGGYLTAERAASPVVIREEQVVTTGLTARELDRAVRRDSRRYDGGMSIY